jgi:hypothetical protein
MSTLPGVWIQLPVLSKNVTTDVLGALKSRRLLIRKCWAMGDLNLRLPVALPLAQLVFDRS